MADKNITDKNITQLTALLYAAMANSDLLAGVDVSADETVKMTLEDIAKFVLGNRAIGTNVATSITTNNGSQTMTNKTLTSPKINENAILTAKSSDLNKLSGMTATTADLNKLSGMTATTADLNKLAGMVATKSELNHSSGLTSNIQNQLNSLIAALPSAESILRRFSYGFGASGASTNITQAEVLSGIGAPTGYVINPESLIFQMYLVSAGQHSVDAGVTVDVITKTVNSVLQVDYFKVSNLTPSNAYLFVAHFNLTAAGGVGT